MDFPKTLVVLHYHLRPGGVRRVIENTLPEIIRQASPNLNRVIVLTGETSPDDWETRLTAACGLPIEIQIDSSLCYQTGYHPCADRRARLQKCFDRQTLVWAHNLSVGRNFGLLADLPAACESTNAKLLLHHHDWWFDNRWERVPQEDFAILSHLTFPTSSNILHATLTRADTRFLESSLTSLWLPNPVPIPPEAPQVRCEDWFMPCRVLRRKNLLEALLLKGWIAPSAKLYVMGTASSPSEVPYFESLRSLNQFHFSSGLRPGCTQVVSSLLEGFGLPFIEAAAAQLPFVGRFLPNVSPDLEEAGCELPLIYSEVQIPADQFDFEMEKMRQTRLWESWSKTLPDAARRQCLPPKFKSTSIAFSRLTLTGQLEVLANSPSWQTVEPLNASLAPAVKSGTCPLARLNEAAKVHFSADHYAKRFWRGVQQQGRTAPSQAFDAMLKQKLAVENLHPLLMDLDT